MRVAHFTGLRQIEIVDLPMPKLNKPDAVLLRIDRVGICGSDVHYYTDGRIGDQGLIYPATLGHECAGTVLDVGAAVKHLQIGDRVAVDPAMVCGTCDQCRAGRVNTCRNLRFMGCPGEALGAVADYRVMPAANCLPIPDAMTLDDAALAEPLSVGLHAVRLAELSPGMRIVIIGAGPIGLSVLLCAKAIVSCKTYVIDLLDQRLSVARRCGADWIGNAKHGEAMSSIRQIEPLGVDLVFECSGDPLCVDEAQRLLTPGGTLMLVGIPPTDRVIFAIHQMRRKELCFKNVRRQRNCVKPVIDMIATRQIDPRPLLTHRFPLEKIGEAFDLAAGYRDGVVKAVIDLSSRSSISPNE